MKRLIKWWYREQLSTAGCMIDIRSCSKWGWLLTKANESRLCSSSRPGTSATARGWVRLIVDTSEFWWYISFRYLSLSTFTNYDNVLFYVLVRIPVPCCVLIETVSRSVTSWSSRTSVCPCRIIVHFVAFAKFVLLVVGLINSLPVSCPEVTSIFATRPYEMTMLKVVATWNAEVLYVPRTSPMYSQLCQELYLYGHTIYICTRTRTGP